PVLKLRIEDYDLLNDENSIENIVDQIASVIHDNQKK
ncbi:MAG: deoxynucleoside kinase, partial [Bacillota bacterium]|nr:deoxynucleoside kinase [Bacillota bacterium]